MKQVKLAQDEKREMLRIMDEVETMSEDSKKLLSPKGAIVCLEHNSSCPLAYRYYQVFP